MYYVITKLLRQVFPATHIEIYCLFIEYGNHITFSLQILNTFINFSRGMADTSDYLRICYTHVRKCNSKVYWKVEMLPFGPPSSKETSTIEQNINLAGEGLSVSFSGQIQDIVLNKSMIPVRILIKYKLKCFRSSQHSLLP